MGVYITHANLSIPENLKINLNFNLRNNCAKFMTRLLKGKQSNLVMLEHAYQNSPES